MTTECAQQEPLLTAEERLAIAEGEVVRLRQRLLAQAWRLGEERRNCAQVEDLKAQLGHAREQARSHAEMLSAERGAHLDRMMLMASTCAHERELRETFHAEIARANEAYIAELRVRLETERVERARERDEWKAERMRLSARADANAEDVFALVSQKLPTLAKRARARDPCDG
jgi:hypothetical protein